MGQVRRTPLEGGWSLAITVSQKEIPEPSLCSLGSPKVNGIDSFVLGGKFGKLFRRR
jgi:hypothetical protein